MTEADAYISDYNIFMDKLRNAQGEQLFPDEMKLISHWGLRDELKSNYANVEKGLEKQWMIYRVMQRIVDQSIPLQVVNNGSYEWNPESNELTENGRTIVVTHEDTRRYEVFLRNFHAMRKLDAYSPHYPTELGRAFDATMEVPQKDVEELFKGLISSPLVKEVAAFIEARLVVNGAIRYLVQWLPAGAVYQRINLLPHSQEISRCASCERDLPIYW